MAFGVATFETYDEGLAGSMVGSNALLEGGLPGFLGIRQVECSAGLLVAELDVRPDLLNPFGTMHGGVVAALVDHVLGAVLYPVIERGQWAATTEFKLNLLGPARSGTVRAESTIIAKTRRTAVVRIEVTCEGRPVAVAQGTVLIQDPKKPANPAAEG